MAELEKVIKGLEEFKADLKPYAGNPADWEKVDNALSLLKAQKPARPIIKQEMDDFCSCIDNVAYCGRCGAWIGRLKQNYCSNCGQKVKWYE